MGVRLRLRSRPHGSMSSSPTSGSVLKAQSLEPASESVSPSLSAPPPLMLSLSPSKINIKKIFFKNLDGGAWVAQSVKCLTLAHVMILRFVGSSPMVGLCADDSEPGACFGFCVSLSLCPSPAHTLSLFLKNEYTLKNKKKKKTWMNLTNVGRRHTHRRTLCMVFHLYKYKHQQN